MKFSSGEDAINWFYETRMILSLSVSLKLTAQRVYFGGGGSKYRKPNLKKIELMATLWYYLGKSSKTWLILIECFHFCTPSMSPNEVARKLNRLQNTRRWNKGTVLQAYHNGMRRFEAQLKQGGLLKGRRSGKQNSVRSKKSSKVS